MELTWLIYVVNINNPSAQMAAIRQQQLLHQQQRQQAMFAQQFQNMNAAGVNSMPMGMQLSPQQLHQLRQRNAAAGLGHVGVSYLHACFDNGCKIKPLTYISLL